MGSLAEAALTTLAVSLCCLPPGRADINHSSGFNSAMRARRSARHRTVSRRERIVLQIHLQTERLTPGVNLPPSLSGPRKLSGSVDGGVVQENLQ